LSFPLNKEDTKRVQAVAGMLLHYDARAVDATILPALSSLATKQAKPTQRTIEKVKYCATQEEAIITYSASKMILCIHRTWDIATKRMLTAKQADIIFYQTTINPPPTIVPFQQT
jgi:hypothetical protein